MINDEDEDEEIEDTSKRPKSSKQQT